MSREECLNLIKSDKRMEQVYTQSTDLCRTVYKRSGPDVIETVYNADKSIKSVKVIADVLS